MDNIGCLWVGILGNYASVEGSFGPSSECWHIEKQINYQNLWIEFLFISEVIAQSLWECWRTKIFVFLENHFLPCLSSWRKLGEHGESGWIGEVREVGDLEREGRWGNRDSVAYFLTFPTVLSTASAPYKDAFFTCQARINLKKFFFQPKGDIKCPDFQKSRLRKFPQSKLGQWAVSSTIEFHSLLSTGKLKSNRWLHRSYSVVGFFFFSFTEI